MKEIRTEIEIAAPAERVWRVLADFAAWGEWNPFITRVQGEPQPGARIRFRLRPVGLPFANLRATVLVATPARELRWRGSLPIPGLFAGEHYYVLEPQDTNSVRFVHGERFSGLLIAPAAWLLDARIAPRFSEMNRALKLRVEAAS